MKINYKKKIFVLLFVFLTTLIFASSSVNVYVTANGKKYHKRSCRTLAKSKTVTTLTIDEAKKKGYSPCKVCNP